MESEIAVMTSDSGTRGVFLVVDYAEGRAEQVERLVRAASRAQGLHNPVPVRILLLARTAGTGEGAGWRHSDGDWWQRLLDPASPDTAPARLCFRETPLRADGSNEIPPGARQAFVESAIASFDTRLAAPALAHLPAPQNARVPLTRMQARLDASGNPLLLTIEAYLHVFGSAMQGGPLAELAHEETQHWLRAVSSDRPDFRAPVAKAMAYAASLLTLSQGGPAAGAEAISQLACARAFGTAAEPRDVARAELQVQAAIKKLYLHGALEPIRPDLLGEHIAAQRLAEVPGLAGQFIDAAPAAAAPALAVLSRATRKDHDPATQRQAQSVLTDLLSGRLGTLSGAVVKVVLSEEGALASLAEAAVPRTSSADLRVLARALPVNTVRLLPLSAAVARQLHAGQVHDPFSGAPEDLQPFLEAIRSIEVLIANGEALAALDIGKRAAQEAAGQLKSSGARGWWPRFMALCLFTQANALDQLRRLDEALDYAGDAKDLLMALEDTMDIDEGLMAGLLVTLSAIRGRGSDRGLALAAAEEAVRFLDGKPFQKERLRATTNLALEYLLAGRPAEALPVSEAVLRERRALYEADPDANLENLLASLKLHSGVLSQLDAEGALALADEATRLAEDAWRRAPNGFANAFASALGNRAQMLLVNRRPYEAIRTLTSARNVVDAPAGENQELYGRINADLEQLKTFFVRTEQDRPLDPDLDLSGLVDDPVELTAMAAQHLAQASLAEAMNKQGEAARRYFLAGRLLTGASPHKDAPPTISAGEAMLEASRHALAAGEARLSLRAAEAGAEVLSQGRPADRNDEEYAKLILAKATAYAALGDDANRRGALADSVEAFRRAADGPGFASHWPLAIALRNLASQHNMDRLYTRALALTEEAEGYLEAVGESPAKQQELTRLQGVRATSFWGLGDFGSARTLMAGCIDSYRSLASEAQDFAREIAAGEAILTQLSAQQPIPV